MSWGLTASQPHSIPDVGVVIVRDILHSEDLAVLLRFLVLWPEGRIGLKITKRETSLPRAEVTDIADPRRGVAEDDHSRAVVIVDQRPEITAGAHLV